MLFKKLKKMAAKEAAIENFHKIVGQDAKVVLESDGEQISVEAEGLLPAQIFMVASFLAATSKKMGNVAGEMVKDTFDAYYELEMERLSKQK